MNVEESRDGSMLDRFMSFAARVQPREKRHVGLGIVLLFCVFAGYGAVKPVRDTIGTVIGTEATQDLWWFTALFGILAVPSYGWLVATVRRAVLLPAIYGFMAVGFTLCAWGFWMYPKDPVLSRVFYVYISVMNLMTISIFWSFLLEVFDSAQTKRLFAVIAVGGTAGAFFGPLITRGVVAAIGNHGVLLVGAGFYVAALFLQRLIILAPRSSDSAPAALAEQQRPIGGNPFAGFMLVMRSPYLRGIMLFIVGISAINTFLYFEAIDMVAKRFNEITRRTEVFANLDAIIQGLTALTQLFLTGRIATRFGLTLLLVAVPFIMVLGLTWFAFSGTFMVLAIALIVRRWGEYAFIRPGREMLFSRVDKESKYKAKNLCDVAVYRSADVVFAQIKQLFDRIGVSGMKETMIVAGVSFAWGLNGWWLARRHEKEAPKP